MNVSCGPRAICHLRTWAWLHAPRVQIWLSSAECYEERNPCNAPRCVCSSRLRRRSAEALSPSALFSNSLTAHHKCKHEHASGLLASAFEIKCGGAYDAFRRRLWNLCSSTANADQRNTTMDKKRRYNIGRRYILRQKPLFKDSSRKVRTNFLSFWKTQASLSEELALERRSTS